MAEPSDRLADPAYAAFAWGRYRRLLKWMLLAAAVAVAGALLCLWLTGSLVSVHLVVATVAGVGSSVMLAAALMGLVFLSSGTGHDDDAARGGRES